MRFSTESIQRILASILSAATLSGCSLISSQDDDRFVYYLHGRIVEEQGPKAYSPEFGYYDYEGILEALDRPGITVVSEVRQADTDPSEYANEIATDIRRLIASGVHPSRITVIGASKGGIIAALVSHRLQATSVRYVLMGSCNPWLTRTLKPQLSGDTLSIFEASDRLGRSCADLAKLSPEINRFSEVQLNTGLGHGFLYQPLEKWINPAVDWAINDREEL